MRVVHHLPASPLRAIVDRYWSWEGADALRLLPLMPSPGGLELFFHYGTPFALDEHGTRRLPRAHFACIRTRPVELFQRGPTGFVAVRIRAGMGERLTGAAMTELADAFVDAADVWGTACGDVLERLAESNAMEARVAILDRFLLSRVRDDRRAASQQPALDRLLRDQASVAEAARDAGLGTRQLEKRFRAATGVAPARFRRLARLRRSLRALLLAPDHPTLTSLLDPAYHDQPQQVREFRELTGFTPGQLRRVAATCSHFYNPSWPR